MYRRWWRRRWRDRVSASDGNLSRLSSGNPAVTLQEAKEHLRQDIDDEDALIERSIRSVQDELEPPNGWLGRALTTSTYRLSLPELAGRIVLPCSPLQQVDSFEYRNTEGDFIEVDSEKYRVTDDEPSEIVLERDKTWPVDIDLTQPDCVRVDITAGFGDDSDDVPEVIRQWIVFQLAQRYDIRQSVVVGTIATPIPYIRHMLEGWRMRE